MAKLIPKCIESNKSFGHSAGGWLLPCCWLDPNQEVLKTNDVNINALFTDDLKLENVDSIEEILFSDAWLNFNEVLLGPYENVPKICKLNCSSQKVKKHRNYVS